MTTDILIIATFAFWNNYKKQSPKGKLTDVESYCSSVWNDYIDNGNYQANFYSDTTYSIDTYSLPTDLDHRLSEVDNRLQNNYSDYSKYNAIVVLDYVKNDDWYGVSYTGTAHTSSNYTCLVDTREEDEDSVISAYQSVMSEGVAYHELSHLFGAEHPEDNALYFTNDTSLIYGFEGAGGCKNNGTYVDQVTGIVSGCTQQQTRDHIDANN